MSPPFLTVFSDVRRQGPWRLRFQDGRLSCRGLVTVWSNSKRAFLGLTLETTREDILLGLIRGNSAYQEQHIKEVSGLVKLGRKVMTTGGGSKIRNFLESKTTLDGQQS